MFRTLEPIIWFLYQGYEHIQKEYTRIRGRRHKSRVSNQRKILYVIQKPQPWVLHERFYGLGTEEVREIGASEEIEEGGEG